MTKKIIEYKMHKAGAKGMKTPDFIEDGGHFFDSGTDEFIGLADNDREYWMPNTDKDTPAGTLTELTRAELITRMQTLGMNDEEGDPMTDEEISTFITDWCDDNSVET